MKVNGKDKIAILEDKYNSMEDTDYKKKQLWSKIEMLKRKLTPKVFWTGGTYIKKNEEEAMKARLEAARQKDIEENAAREEA